MDYAQNLQKDPVKVIQTTFRRFKEDHTGCITQIVPSYSSRGVFNLGAAPCIYPFSKRNVYYIMKLRPYNHNSDYFKLIMNLC